MRASFFVLVLCWGLLFTTQSCIKKPNQVDGGVVVGRVLDASGSVVAGATIRTDPASTTVTSDADGIFVFNDLPPGSYVIAASAGGHSGHTSVTVVDDQTTRCTITLDGQGGGNGGSGAGGALQFDGMDGGSGSYLVVDHTPDLNLNGNSYTLEAWCNPASIMAHSMWGQWIMNKGNSNDDNEYLLGYDRSGKMTFWSSYTGTIWSRTSMVPGHWYHVALVVDATNHIATMYINGVADGSVSFTSYADPRKTSAPLFIGARNYFGQNFGVENWDGKIDEVRIWNIARSSSQINSAMNHTLNGTETGLVGYWKFDDTGAQTTNDGTSLGHVASFVNSVTRVISTAPIQ